VQGIMLVLAVCVVAGNFLADVLYTLVDPRVELR
jgi:ABC-type dipeptide/oligopeptide/nickel transport system permease component